MAEKLFARNTADGLWQWRRVASDGHWSGDTFKTGDADALAQEVGGDDLPVALVVPGQWVVSTHVEIDIKDKRHFAKLLPYEMEEELIDSVEDLHMAFGPITGDSVDVLYLKSDVMNSVVADLIAANCDFRTALPDYLNLIVEDKGLTFIYEDGVVIARLGKMRGFAIEASMAPMILADLGETQKVDGPINLVAENDYDLDKLTLWLPEQWRSEAEDSPELVRNIGGLWDWIDTGSDRQPINLRSGSYSRQLPLTRWLQEWKTPLVALAAAYVIALAVTFFQYQVAKSQQKTILSQMNAVYQQAVPNGRGGDPERKLETLVKTLKGGPSGGTTNFVALLNSVAKAVKQAGNITMSSIRYTGDQRELMLNIEGSSFAELETLRGAVTAEGFAAELLRVEAKGDRHSARMKVTEVAK
ncbi:type II secretion system protein GspL [Teredinibacter waterburyi]|uniref:type II secretion system protein GspL n=1 Tax=Teredinibacter waterburyi TaxID=1500538 RepID=UPI00165EE3BC|nr:type II secretion system protein GspL [Teredinibacter waterburyi]